MTTDEVVELIQKELVACRLALEILASYCPAADARLAYLGAAQRIDEAASRLCNRLLVPPIEIPSLEILDESLTSGEDDERTDGLVFP